MTTEIKLVEALGPATANGGKKWRARIIASDVWGSSAYYPREVLERDGARVFTAGLPMYANHPSDTETYDRPERSVHDLVGKLVSDAVFEEDGLYADVEFYESFVKRINELHEDVGLSVRATGLTEYAEMDGREGPMLVALLAADSVDVVTKAGAGGKLTSILESDRELAGRPIDTKGTQSVTDVTKEDFEAFQTALLEAISGISASVAEALKPEVPEEKPVTNDDEKPADEVVDEDKDKDDEVAVDTVAVATAVVEAKLPASAISIVTADVAKGVALTEAIKRQTDYRDSLLETNETGVVVINEGAKAHGLARAVTVLG